MMEQRLIILLFFTGALPLVLSITRKFYLIQQMKTWPDAQLYCRNNHIDLATIESDSDKARLQDEVTSKQFTSSAWIGLFDDPSYYWSRGNVTLGSWTKWGTDQPNNPLEEECVAIDFTGYWWDAYCTDLYNFMCFDERKTGLSRYVYYTVNKTWHDAQTFCRQQHTDLASSLNSVDNTDMVTVIANIAILNWFGLFKNSWKWSDQTPLSTINWVPGLPGSNLNAHCGSIKNNQYVNAACQDLMPFFCYSVVHSQKMIRVKVVSDQSVEDPAVKAMILGKIQQLLKDHGMGESTSMKWNEKPDGNVFHKIKRQ